MRTYTLITAFIILFSSLESFAQCESFTFTRQGQIDSFAINHPMCTTVQRLIIEGRDIQNLDSLNKIEMIVSGPLISINNTSLTSISGFPIANSSANVSITNNPLLSIISWESKIGEELGVGIEGNDILETIEFQDMDSTQLYLTVQNNPILKNIIPNGAIFLSLELINNPSFENFHAFTDIELIENITLISNGHIENFEGFENVKRIEELTITSEDGLDQSIQNMKGFNAVKEIDFIQISGVHSLEGLESLTTAGSVYLGGDLLRDTIGNFLKDLKGLQNLTNIEYDFKISAQGKLKHLEHLNDNLIIGGTLNITSNPILNICSNTAVCRHLFFSRPSEIGQNASLCADRGAISLSCEGFKAIPVRFFYDKNENQIFDAGESIIRNIDMTIDSDNLYLIDQSDRQFKYAILDPGDHIISFVERPIWELTTSNASYMIHAEDTYYDTIFNFGFKPAYFETDITTDAIIETPRCLTKVPLDINMTNNGTTTATGYLWVELSTNIDTICFPKNPPDTLISEHHFGYIFSNLFPGNSKKEEMSIEIPGPPDFMIGDSFSIKSYVTFEDENGITLSDTSYLREEIQCSYDPNDKLVNPKRANDNYTLIDETLNYTIRFQNTGNAEAFDVVVRDTLDPNLDVSTFKLVGSSHEEILQTFIKDDQYITFEFKNIFLPDSTTDFEGSNGYVSYTIEHKEGIDENTKIENTAHIYFDFNPPIVTNTTENIMVSMFPTSTNNLNPNLDIRIYPNPSDGILYFEGADLEWDATVEIVDLNGKVVMKNQLRTMRQINLGGLNSGVYFVHIIQDNGRFSGKVIVE